MSGSLPIRADQRCPARASTAPTRDRPRSIGPTRVAERPSGRRARHTASRNRRLGSCRRTRSCRRHERCAGTVHQSASGSDTRRIRGALAVRSASCLGSVMPCRPCCRAPPIMLRRRRWESQVPLPRPDPQLAVSVRWPTAAVGAGSPNLPNPTLRVHGCDSPPTVRLSSMSARTRNSATFAVTTANVEIPTSMVNTPTTRPSAVTG